MPRIQIEVPQTEIAHNCFYFVVTLPDTVTRAEIQAEFDANPAAFCKKHIKKMSDYRAVDCLETELVAFKDHEASITFLGDKPLPRGWERRDPND